ncbi:MAG: tetratricopeptide repeat protein [Candidatus Korobacteraceae bacterium]
MTVLRTKFFASLLLLLAVAVAAADPAVVELLSLGRMNDAISELVNRNDAESLHLLSRAYYATEHWDDAVKCGERAVVLRPNDAGYHLWLAREYGGKAANANPMTAAATARRAKNEFEQAVQLDPLSVEARLDLAQFYTEAPAIMGGGLDKARDQAAQVAKYNSAKSHLMLARVAEKEKQFAEAETQLRQAIGEAKDSAEYWLDLAAFYRARGRLDDMQTAVRTALAQSGRPAEAYFDAANELFLGNRDFPDAVLYLQKYLASGALVEGAPAFRAHYQLGQIYEKMGQEPAAVSEYQASLALASGFDRARRALNHLQ